MKQILIGKIGLMLVVLIVNVCMGFKSKEYFNENKYLFDIEPNELLSSSIQNSIFTQYEGKVINNENCTEEKNLWNNTFNLELVDWETNDVMVQYFSTKLQYQTIYIKPLCLSVINSAFCTEDNSEKINDTTKSLTSDLEQTNRDNVGLINVFNQGIIRLNPINI